MKIGRVAVLGVAAVAGLVAAVIAIRLVTPAAPPAVQTEVKAPPPIPTTDILVATHDIPIGGKLAPDAMRWQTWPAADISPTFIAKTGDGNTQTTALAGSIARASIFANEPIAEAKLIHSDRGFMSAILPQGMRAVAIRISADVSAGGFILPNDRVDVIMTRKATTLAASGGNDYQTETILNNVRVLAIDQTIENSQTNSSSTKNNDSGQTVIGQTATLELSPQQTQIVTVAQQMAEQAGGRLTLALRSVADSRVQPGDNAADAVHLIGGTKKNGAVTIVRSGVASDVSTIR